MSELLEVYSVLLFSNQSDEGLLRGGEIQGTVFAKDVCGSIVYFEEGQSDDSILPDGTLAFTQPSRCIVGEDWAFRLNFNLKKGDKDLQLCDGYVMMSPARSWPYRNQPVSGVVPGRDGYAVVNFVLLSYAVQATVEVSLVGNVVGPGFYGYVRARNDAKQYPNAYEKRYFQTTLFSASQDKPVYAKDNKIPLLRCVTAVPCFKRLILEAQIFDATTHNQVAGDCASFKSREYGAEARTIGCLQVKVTWAAHERHSWYRPELCL